MTTSRLKFELIDGSESVGSDGPQRPRDTPPPRAPTLLNGSRRPLDMMTNQLAGLGQHSENGDWPHKPETLRSSVAHSVLDPGLLGDLAEGLEFLHRQLEDSESELEHSREQSRAFEQDARRWEDEAARLREESEETRASLDQLRHDFENSLEGSRRQQAMVERIVVEMAEIRAARDKAQQLAAEQQRALVLSLELLKRVGSEEVLEPTAFEEVPVAYVPPIDGRELEAKDNEILELKRLIQAAGEEGERLDTELEATRTELASRNGQWASAQVQLEALDAELIIARAEIDTKKSEIEAFGCELVTAASQLEAARSEVSQLLERVHCFESLPAAAELKPEIVESPELLAKMKEMMRERVDVAQKLQAAEAEIAIQNAEVESRGAIIIALESALEEQNSSLRSIEERFLAYAEHVQSLQLHRLEMPKSNVRGIALKFVNLFVPPKRTGS